MKRVPRSTAVSSLVAACLLLGTVALPAPGYALEFKLDGYDRVRGQVFTGLSLDDPGADPLNETQRLLILHRLRLIPELRVNSHLSVFAEADLFDNRIFGTPKEGVVLGTLGASGEPWTAPPALTGTVVPGSGAATGLVRRAWMEIQAGPLPLRFRLGRMPNHWGAGLVYNDGEGWDADYGDSVDRIEASLVYKDILIRAAFDSWTEDFVNLDDDVHGVTASAGYLGEVLKAGLLFEHRWTGKAAEDRFQVTLADLWGKVRLGPLELELEGAINFGKGSIPDSGFEEAQVLSGGAVFEGTLDMDPIVGGVAVTFATGDKDPSDAKAGTFVVDADHDLGLLMFEQPMPVLMVNDINRPGTSNIDSSQVLMAEGVSNAFVVSPFVGYSPYDSLDLELRFNAAWAVVKSAATNDQKQLGIEINLGGKWRLWESLEFGARAAVFVPGKAFADSRRRPAFGGELRAIIRFD